MTTGFISGECVYVCVRVRLRENRMRERNTHNSFQSFAVKGKRIREEVIVRENGVKAEEEFEYFVQYQMATCERQDLIGAGAHTLDILRKE